MKRRQNEQQIPPKYVLLVLSVVCIIFLIITSFLADSVPFLNNICGSIIVPMEQGVNTVGDCINERVENIRDTKEIRKENEELQAREDELRQIIKLQESDQTELKNLRELYELDQKYESYDKVGARIIASDSSTWYSTFTIDKGTEDGIAVDMNVIAGNGLVGIVYSVGKNYAKVRSIIDDTSYVSGMFSNESDQCIVNGDLKSISDGYITVDHIDKNAKIADGDEIVTSNISSKFLPGITIGYISDVTLDDNNLTQSGKVTPVVDFKHLEEVLVITQLKTVGEENGEDDK